MELKLVKDLVVDVKKVRMQVEDTLDKFWYHYFKSLKVDIGKEYIYRPNTEFNSEGIASAKGSTFKIVGLPEDMSLKELEGKEARFFNVEIGAVVFEIEFITGKYKGRLHFCYLDELEVKRNG